MALDAYVGGTFVNDIYANNSVVNRVYKGNQLVYSKFKQNQVILESASPINRNILLVPGLYEVIFIGGGGGSSGSGGGGSGSGWYPNTTVQGESGT